MASIATVTWVFGLLLCITLTIRGFREKQSEFDLVSVCFIFAVAWFIVSLITGISLYEDIYDQSGGGDCYLGVLSGLSALGWPPIGYYVITQIVSTRKNIPVKMRTNNFHNFVNIVSLISAILGILSFYLVQSG